MKLIVADDNIPTRYRMACSGINLLESHCSFIQECLIKKPAEKHIQAILEKE